MQLLDLLLSALGMTGLIGLGLALINRFHGLHLPLRLLKFGDKIFAVLLAVVVMLACWHAVRLSVWPWSLSHLQAAMEQTKLAFWPAVLAWSAGVWLAPQWIGLRCRRPPAPLLEDRYQTLDVTRKLGRLPAAGAVVRCLTALPGNQVFRPQLHEKTLAVQGLPLGLEGMTIAHLSDLHLQGAITRDYFRCLFEAIDQWRPDMLVLTGDIIDHPRCLPWIDELFPALRAPYGAHFVLGNHDLRINDEAELRGRMTAAGWSDVSQRVERLASPCGALLVVAGNEAPWFGPPPCAAQLPEVPPEAFRILASHAPDQLPWARRHGFDLMLAGHTHGGQVRLPLLGPVFVPSRFGLKYSDGVFQDGPTVMHVSRGMGGLEPLRWNCPPEVTLLRLLRAAPQSNRNAPKPSGRQVADAGVVHV